MEAARAVELTGTNCSIGLISRNSCVVVNASYGTEIRNIPEFYNNLRFFIDAPTRSIRLGSRREILLDWFLYIASFCRPGGYGRGSPPDPIPNSVVKSPSADGTAS